MARVARTSVLAIPAIAFALMTNLAPTLRPSLQAAGQSIAPDPARANLMKAHYRQVLIVHDAIARGDLPAVAPAARAIAAQEPPTGLRPSAMSSANTLKEIATRTAAATTLEAAARETASMLVTCGQCHLAAGTRPAPPSPPATNVGGAVGHMIEHQRAIDQMLQALVLPSASLWREGTAALKVASLHRSDLPRSAKLPAALADAEKRVHQWADQASTLTEPAAQARSYAQILTTCAECHGLHSKIWGPSGR